MTDNGLDEEMAETELINQLECLLENWIKKESTKKRNDC